MRAASGPRHLAAGNGKPSRRNVGKLDVAAFGFPLMPYAFMVSSKSRRWWVVVFGLCFAESGRSGIESNRRLGVLA